MMACKGVRLHLGEAGDLIDEDRREQVEQAQGSLERGGDHYAAAQRVAPTKITKKMKKKKAGKCTLPTGLAT